jgi:hypothetical protein
VQVVDRAVHRAAGGAHDVGAGVEGLAQRTHVRVERVGHRHHGR